MNDKLKSVDIVNQPYQTFYDPQQNAANGNEREENLKNVFFNNQMNIEIKTDIRPRDTGNFFIEIQQILCGTNKWIKSGLLVDNITNWWFIVVPHINDTKCEDIEQQYILIRKRDIIKKIERAIKEKTYGKSKPLPDDVPDFVKEGHKPHHSYKIDICPNGSKRYSRGILLPLGILENPRYL